MVKLQLLVLAAVASVISAVDIYEHDWYGGHHCQVNGVYDQGGLCYALPASCGGIVSSVKVRKYWTCKLFEGGGCNGSSVDVYGEVPSLSERGFNDRAYGIKCWSYA
ncbi:hypothetical protein BGX34_001658 [Mortierella sp. NVP85]|nr:hypothetical protein BGX34_001658 [Mortierella sp. NVP85]